MKPNRMKTNVTVMQHIMVASGQEDSTALLKTEFLPNMKLRLQDRFASCYAET